MKCISRLLSFAKKKFEIFKVLSVLGQSTVKIIKNMSYRINKMLSLYLIFTILTVLMFITYIRRQKIFENVAESTKSTSFLKNSIHCFDIKTDTLEDISDTFPIRGKSIFFHETSCNSHLLGKIFLTARQACAVESAAKLNPNFQVYLLFTSPGTFKFEETLSDRLLQAILSYKNLKINHLDYGRYTKGTPVEDLYHKGAIQKSRYALSHASDILRYLTLWKYGGIYLDLDIIVIKSLESLALNYAGRQDSATVAAGVLSFTPEGRGHLLAEKCVNDLKDNFRGDIWGHNGPGVITRLTNEICKSNQSLKVADQNCQDFKIFPEEAFYAVPYWKWNWYFEEKFTQKTLDLIQNSYILHVWNKLSGKRKIKIEGNSTYAIYARKFCPKVVEQCSDLF